MLFKRDRERKRIWKKMMKLYKKNLSGEFASFTFTFLNREYKYTSASTSTNYKY